VRISGQVLVERPPLLGEPRREEDCLVCTYGDGIRALLLYTVSARNGRVRHVLAWAVLAMGCPSTQARVTEKEPTLGLGWANGARLAACHRFRKGEGVTRRRKGRRSRSPSLRGLKEPGFGCPHVVNAVAEVGRRRLTSNKLGKRAPKRAVRVE
jgi:hypothetical protein